MIHPAHCYSQFSAISALITTIIFIRYFSKRQPIIIQNANQKSITSLNYSTTKNGEQTHIKAIRNG